MLSGSLKGGGNGYAFFISFGWGVGFENPNYGCYKVQAAFKLEKAACTLIFIEGVVSDWFL